MENCKYVQREKKTYRNSEKDRTRMINVGSIVKCKKCGYEGEE